MGNSNIFGENKVGFAIGFGLVLLPDLDPYPQKFYGSEFTY